MQIQKRYNLTVTGCDMGVQQTDDPATAALLIDEIVIRRLDKELTLFKERPTVAYMERHDGGFPATVETPFDLDKPVSLWEAFKDAGGTGLADKIARGASIRVDFGNGQSLMLWRM